jgi:DinB superfamily
MPFELNDAIQILERTPATLRALLTGLSPTWTTATEGQDTWTPHEVIAHLINGERTDWIPRTRHLLEYGESRPFDPFDRTGGFEEARDRPLADLLREFAMLREEGLATLRDLQLAERDLDRRGRHPSLGPVTLRQHLASWTVHDLTHISQIVRVLAVQYREDVGPWRQYLRIVQ